MGIVKAVREINDKYRNPKIKLNIYSKCALNLLGGYLIFILLLLLIKFITLVTTAK